jgi:glycopeptide antibiotics resistance protein
MAPNQLDIPALPILLPLGLALMIGSWAALRRCGLATVRRLVTAWLAGWYLVAVLGATLLPLHLAWGAGAGEPELFRIILVPVTTMRVDDFILNIVMTLPLAALLHLVFGIRGRGRVVLTGFLLSAGVEVIQAVLVTLHGNRWADVNDLLSNTLGAFLGYLAWRRLLRHDAVRRTVRDGALVAHRCPAAPASVIRS